MPITYEELQARKQEEAKQRIEQKKQQNPTVSPEVIEYLSQLEKINKESVNHTGNIVALGAELSGGIAGTYALDKIHKADKFGKLIKGVQATRAASLLGFAGPQIVEPVSTVTGALTFMGSSAAIWGLSNLAGQNIRKAYGLLFSSQEGTFSERVKEVSEEFTNNEPVKEIVNFLKSEKSRSICKPKDAI